MVCIIYSYVVCILILILYFVVFIFYRIGAIGLKAIIDRFNIRCIIKDETRRQDIIILPETHYNGSTVVLVYEFRNHYSYLEYNGNANKLNNNNGKNGFASPTLTDFKEILNILNEGNGVT